MLTHLVLSLPPDRFARLLTLITTAEGKHQRGGYQGRKRRWRDHINEAARAIELDTDDVGWIQRQIVNCKGGGWQAHVSRIFTDQHPPFTRLPALPRRPEHERRHRTVRATEGTARP